MFDGETLKGWDGNTSICHVENGVIVAESTCEKTTGTTYRIWQAANRAILKARPSYAAKAPESIAAFRIAVSSSSLAKVGAVHRMVLADRPVPELSRAAVVDVATHGSLP
jgi:hypothetical protein